MVTYFQLLVFNTRRKITHFELNGSKFSSDTTCYTFLRECNFDLLESLKKKNLKA